MLISIIIRTTTLASLRENQQTMRQKQNKYLLERRHYYFIGIENVVLENLGQWVNGGNIKDVQKASLFNKMKSNPIAFSVKADN